MALHPGYNLVTKEVESTEEALPALAFFRRLAADEPVDSRVTVTDLEELLYYADEDDRDAVLRKLRDVLRETQSFKGAKAIQFVVDGELVDDDAFSVRIEREGSPVYLQVGNIFVEHPRVEAPHHAVARK